ncbi:hypothetical protein HK104_001732 [Borealophlyctis nickersoniae]|nr:hypothetical protein HK104_001732 [Borealophlyctis nickersoniae]
MIKSEIECKVFWMLVVIVEDLLPPEMYGNTLEGAQIAQDVLWTFVVGKQGSRFGVGKVAQWVQLMDKGGDVGVGSNGKWFRRNGRAGQAIAGGRDRMPPLSMITTQWFMTLFINVLPVETVLRVWDCFFYQGEKILMRVALTLIKIHEEQILSFTEPMEAWSFIKDMPKSIIDCHKLMQICFRPRRLNPFKTPVIAPSAPMPVQQQQQYPHPRRPSMSSVASSPYGLSRKGSKRFRTGVGSVSKEMIDRYRVVAMERRRKARSL